MACRELAKTPPPRARTARGGGRRASAGARAHPRSAQVNVRPLLLLLGALRPAFPAHVSRAWPGSWAWRSRAPLRAAQLSAARPQAAGSSRQNPAPALVQAPRGSSSLRASPHLVSRLCRWWKRVGARTAALGEPWSLDEVQLGGAAAPPAAACASRSCAKVPCFSGCLRPQSMRPAMCASVVQPHTHSMRPRSATARCRGQPSHGAQSCAKPGLFAAVSMKQHEGHE